jgi:hypothetical protein
MTSVLGSAASSAPLDTVVGLLLASGFGRRFDAVARRS